MRSRLHPTIIFLMPSAFIAGAAGAITLFVTPDCPSPADSVAILAYQQKPPPGLLAAPLIASQTGRVLKIVGQGNKVTIGGPSPSSARVDIGKLPIGGYHMDFYLRIDTDGLGPEELVASKDSIVRDNPPACTPATLSVAGSSFLTALLNHPVPSPLQVQVLDAQQRPVPGVTVHFTRLDRPEDVSTPDEPAPDATLSSDRAVTDNSGRAQVTAAANDVAGSYQYVATVMRGPETLKAYFVLANRPRMDSVPLTPVVEYVNSNDGHYFITADAGEMSKLDSGVLTGWARTGSVFSALLPGPNGIAVDSKSVCRFYGRQHAGIGSHFPSASPADCQTVKGEFGETWLLESDPAFNELLPDPVSGECPTGSSPLFSAYNNREDANHRYSPSIAVIHGLVFDGWIAEGYGPNSVAMCFPE